MWDGPISQQPPKIVATSFLNLFTNSKNITNLPKKYSIKEYGAILEKYNARTGYPKIN